MSELKKLNFDNQGGSTCLLAARTAVEDSKQSWTGGFCHHHCHHCHHPAGLLIFVILIIIIIFILVDISMWQRSHTSRSRTNQLKRGAKFLSPSKISMATVSVHIYHLVKFHAGKLRTKFTFSIFKDLDSNMTSS